MLLMANAWHGVYIVTSNASKLKVGAVHFVASMCVQIT